MKPELFEIVQMGQPRSIKSSAISEIVNSE